MRAPSLLAAMLACSPPQAAPPTPRPSPPPRFERIDDGLLDTTLHAIAMQFEERGWVAALRAHRDRAPPKELPWIDQALLWGDEPFSHGRNNGSLARAIGDGFAALYPDDPCIPPMAVDMMSVGRPDALVDSFVKCFPNVARAHQYAGEKCRRMPDIPTERELQLVACAKSFARCIELDARHPSCAHDLGELQREWTAPYCTTASLTPKLRAEFRGDAGRLTLDAADFEYAIQSKANTTLVLSERGRKRIQSWFGALSKPQTFASVEVTTRVGSFPVSVWREAFALELISPTPADVCDQIQRRKISDFP